MPQKYSVLDNGQGPSKEQRRFVRQYLKKKGVKRAAPGMERSKREKRLRGEARALYRASKTSGKSTTSTVRSNQTVKMADEPVTKRSIASVPKGSKRAPRKPVRRAMRSNYR